MNVIGGAYGNRVYILLTFQHLSEIRIDLGLGEGFETFRPPILVDVAKGDDLSSGLGGACHVRRSLSSDSNAGQVNSLIRPPYPRGRN